VVGVRMSRVVAPGPPTFELHTLGWRAFQDLCVAMMRTVLGQEVHAFADSNDGGRDGAFYGSCHNALSGGGQGCRVDGPFVLQCKHSRRAGTTLSAAALESEFAKIPPLVERGLCRSYVLMTSARVTGNAEEKTLGRLRRARVEHPLVLDGQWVCDQIATNRDLRMFVPRVYGLGDLSQILDERVYAQASALLASARDVVSTFVITEPYRKAAEALSQHGFALLLGEPASGKTAIAHMLALAAADNWGCTTMKARTASELVSHWNPNEPRQFFWVDDAFGTVRHDERLTSDWSRSMEHVIAAISRGARVVLTSRSYIYHDAEPLLKAYAHPHLNEQQIVVDVEDLSPDERRQILYNHLADGDQPVEIRAGMKPFLDGAADADPFSPEMARRLGRRTFTGSLSFTENGVTEFMTRPRQFLGEVYEQLSPDQQAALALVYAAVGGSLENPPQITQERLDIIARIGSTPAGAARALGALTGDFLQVTAQPFAQDGWTFRHPTLSEGFAAWLATQPLLLPVMLDGLSDSALLDRTDCGEGPGEKRGILLRVPAALYDVMARRLTGISQPLYSGQRYIQEDGNQVDLDSRTGSPFSEREIRKQSFLSYLHMWCSDTFLREYLKVDANLPGHLMEFDYVTERPELYLLARLYEAGLLEEKVRLQAVDRLAELVAVYPDAGWADDWNWDKLLTPGDRAKVLDRVHAKLVPELDNDDGWFSRETRDPVYDHVEEVLRGYMDAFAAAHDHVTSRAFGDALDRHLQRPEDSGAYAFEWASQPLAHEPLTPPPDTNRSIFDDLDHE
jgi:hypothetical protein